MNNLAECRFSDFVGVENVLCRLAVEDWESAVEALVSVLHENHPLFDPADASAACKERERATSTVIAPRLALPHARVDKIPQVLVAIATLSKPVLFAQKDRGPVEVVILILTPKSSPGLYLQVLAALSQEFRTAGTVDKLLLCESPEEVVALFDENGLHLPAFLRARDVMNPHPDTLRESDTLKKVISVFCSKKLMDLPVIDEEGDLRGTVSLEDLLRLCLPEHLLWMHDLTSVIQFEPFAEMLRQDQENKVADFMKDTSRGVSPDTPAIQLAKMFITQSVRQILVVEKGKLLGTVNLNTFVPKLLWE